MSIILTLFELLVLVSVLEFIQLFIYHYPIILFVTTSLSLYGIYLFSKSKLIYSKNFMKGALYDANFPHGVKFISNLAVPIPNKNQVLIFVRSAALNPVDYKLILPKIPFLRWIAPPTFGRDFSGEIIQLGPGVTSFKLYDKVFGNAIGGSIQEYTIANIDHIALKPEKMTWDQAAGLGLAPTTSFQALKLGKIKSNANVLIIGGSGGTGRFAVAIAKHNKARVLAVCSTLNVEDVYKIGADKVLDYTKPNYLQEIKDEKFDIIYDTVTSPEDIDQTPIFKPFLKENGRFIAINGRPITFIRGILFNIPIDRHYILLLKWNRKDLETVAEIMSEIGMELMVDSVYNFNQQDIEKAFERQKSRRAKGKIILTVQSIDSITH